MSVLFLPPPSPASVPDATETVSGKIRIATSAEATTGTNDLTAMTPLKVKSVVDAAVVGGVTYQGTFDTSAPVDLSNAEKGDLYIISVAGSYQGQTWAVGDHLLVNADMGGTISPSKIDKVDNTDAVTSVAGKTGAVTLVAGDVSGLAAVATSGAYSDLSGTPTLGTAAAEDVGTAASNVVQLDGSARLPAVDGSQLINLPPATVAALDDIGDVTITSVSDGEALVYDSASSEWVNGSAANTVINAYNATGTAAAVSTQDLHIYRLYGSGGFSLAVSATEAGGLVMVDNNSGSACTVTGPTFRRNGEGSSGGVTSITVEAGERRSFYIFTISIWLETTATNLDRLADVSLSSPSSGEALVYNGTLSVFENATVTASVPSASETVEGIIEISTNAEATAATATNKALVPSNLSSINVSTLNNDAGYLTDITGESVGDLSDVTVTTPSAGQALIYNGTLSAFQNAAVSVANLDDIGDVNITSVQDYAVLRYDAGTSEWIDTPQVNYLYSSINQILTAKPGLSRLFLAGGGSSITVTLSIPSIVAAQGSVLNVLNTGSVSSTLTIGVTSWSIAPNQGGVWIATGLNTAYRVADLSPNNVSAFTNDAGYLTDITGESVGDLSDVTISTPSAGEALVYNGTLSVFQNSSIVATVAALDDIGDVDTTGVANTNTLKYNSTSGNWEAGAVAASEVSGLAPTVTLSSPSSSPLNLSTPSAGVIEEAYILSPTVDITVNLVSATTLGSGFKYHFKNRSANVITLDAASAETIDGSFTFVVGAQESSVTLVTNGSNWFII